MFPAINNWRRGEPTPQEYFTFRNGLWYPVEAHLGSSTAPAGPETPVTPRAFQFAVLSWNIDFMRPEDDARMSAALKHLQSLVADKPHPSVIMLNEMTKSDLALIKRADWVREGYNISDATTHHWESPTYGTCILIPHTLPLKSLSRIHYPTTSMQRDALFADIALPDSHTLRLCTTHLESLRASPPLRPAQLAVAAQYLRQAHAGVLGGDLNAIEAFDRTLHAECGLRDAYLEMGGKEGEEAGMTWGQMVGRRQRERFGLGRLDKILFWGGGGEGQGEGGVVMKVVRFGRFGLDVVVEDEGAAARLVCGGELEKAWVTDHLGVRAEFRVEVLEKKLKEKETGREVVGEIRETGVEAGDGQEPVQAPSG